MAGSPRHGRHRHESHLAFNLPRRSHGNPGTPRPDGPADALTLLRADHERIRQLFGAFARLRGMDDEDERKAGLIDELCAELITHGLLEEEIFYPALRAASGDDEMVDEADIEHAGVRELVAQLEVMYPGDEHFEATVAVLAEEVEHHVAREEGEMFEAARAAGLDLDRLGHKLAERRRQLEEDIDPAGGVIDAMAPREGMRIARRAPD
ncbi:hemerythrin domain-containing protein [Massilia sp. Dwa41.01b]|nr:hemerythrin domain-containing protein [Massilia sp. Dwa41.01b]QNB01409.1 hemerythrin domain-containing protein [Massilia sp. Se16.2.3]